MQLHVSRTVDEARCAQFDLDGMGGDITGCGGEGQARQWEHSVAAGYVKVVGSDVDMIVFRKHWSLEKVFHPISPTHI